MFEMVGGVAQVPDGTPSEAQVEVGEHSATSALHSQLRESWREVSRLPSDHQELREQVSLQRRLSAATPFFSENWGRHINAREIDPIENQTQDRQGRQSARYRPGVVHSLENVWCTWLKRAHVFRIDQIR